jgi:hypothetical protein
VVGGVLVLVSLACCSNFQKFVGGAERRAFLYLLTRTGMSSTRPKATSCINFFVPCLALDRVDINNIVRVSQAAESLAMESVAGELDAMLEWKSVHAIKSMVCSFLDEPSAPAAHVSLLGIISPVSLAMAQDPSTAASPRISISFTILQRILCLLCLWLESDLLRTYFHSFFQWRDRGVFGVA